MVILINGRFLSKSIKINEDKLKPNIDREQTLSRYRDNSILIDLNRYRYRDNQLIDQFDINRKVRSILIRYRAN